MAASTFLRCGCSLAAAFVLLFAASTAGAQAPRDLTKLPESDIDFSKLVKNDPLEINLKGKWVLGKFRGTPNGKIIYVRVDGYDHMAFSDTVRLPAGGKAAAPLKARTWTDRSGKFKLQATLVRVDGDKVLLKRSSDGKEIAVAFDKLSETDHKYLKSVETAAAKAAKPDTKADTKTDAKDGPKPEAAPAEAPAPPAGENP
jgi:hypothetical protein